MNYQKNIFLTMTIILITIFILFYPQGAKSKDLSTYDLSILTEPIKYYKNDVQLTRVDKDLIRKKSAVLLNSNYKIIIYYISMDGIPFDYCKNYNSIYVQRINLIKLEFFENGVPPTKIKIKTYRPINLKEAQKNGEFNTVEFAGLKSE